MQNNGSAPTLEIETLDGFAAVTSRDNRDTSPNVRQTAEEIWKKAMESVISPTPYPLTNTNSAVESTEPHLSVVSSATSVTHAPVASQSAVVTSAPLTTSTPHETLASETIRTRNSLGRLRRITLTEVWQNDVVSFAEWVQNSLDLLGEAIALPTTESTNGVPTLLQNAVIECQLGESHHESLVKLLTEIASSNAKLAVWVVERAKAEHLRVIQWLNSSTQTRFYLVKVDAVRIEDSVPAPFYTPIVLPGK